MKRGVITVSLNTVRKMCDAINSPFSTEDGDDDDDNEEEIQSFFNLNNYKSNLNYDEFTLYVMVIIFASIQFALIIRYFLRLSVYFDRLQAEI